VQRTRLEEFKRLYKEKRKDSKREVAIAKKGVLEDWG
jgi:hypothetical protein